MNVRSIHSNIKPLPERLKEARLSRGYTISDLAKEIGVSRQAVSRYELGTLDPGSETIDKIINILGFPISFFTKPIEGSSKRIGTVYFRSRKSADANLKSMIEIKNNWTEEVYCHFDQFIKFPKLNLPNLDALLVKDHYEMNDIEEIAMAVRSFWGLGIGPINNLTMVLEKNGFVISGAEIGREDADACSEMINDKPIVFLGKDKKSAVRTRFNLAHELGHMLMHLYVNQTDLLDKSIFDRIEKEANMFASAFLLPRDSFAKEVLSVSLDHFITLKRRWKVSIAAMIYRCGDLEILTENQVMNLRKQISFRKWNKNEPLDDEFKTDEPIILKTAAKMLIESNIVSPAELVETFKWPASDLEQICYLEAGTLNINSQLLKIEFKQNQVIQTSQN